MLEIQSVYSGYAVQCPLCNTQSTIPVLQQQEEVPSDFYVDFQAAKESLKSGINKGSISIAQFMSQQKLEGGIELLDYSTSEDADITESITSHQGMKYQVGDIIDKGGMGDVFHTRDVNLRRNVAMKVMLDSQTATADQSQRFIEEAQITGQLEHPGIVPLHDLGVDSGGNIFYTMKFIKGKTLHHVLQKIASGDWLTIKNYPLSNLLTIFQKVCNAVAFAHSKNVIHRDLNPENIMLGDYGEVVIMDWGLARVVHRRKSQAERVSTSKPIPNSQHSGDIPETIDGSIVESLGYIAPEQVRGMAEDLDGRTDIFALGAILYNILTLNAPVQGRDLGELIYRTATADILQPAVFNNEAKSISLKTRDQHGRDMPGKLKIQCHLLKHLPERKIPGSLAAVAMKALHGDPSGRYQDVRELQKDIEAYQSGFATRAERAGIRRQLKLFVRRHKTVTALSLSVVLLAVIAAIVSTSQWLVAEHETAAARKEEQSARNAMTALKDCAPDIIELSRMFVENKQMEDALRRISFAVELEPGNVHYLCLQGNILQTMLRLSEAMESYTAALKIDPAFIPARDNRALCRKILDMNKGFSSLQNASLVELYRRIRSQERYDEAIAVAQHMIASGGGTRVEGILSEIFDTAGIKNAVVQIDTQYICRVSMDYSPVADLSPLMGMPINDLNLRYSAVKNISALKGIPLTSLNISYTSVNDLSPLKNMPLTCLKSDHNAVTDLAPIKDAPIKTLILWGSKISDLSILKGMPIAELDVRDTGFRNFDLLKSFPLTRLEINGINNLTVLKGLKLTYLNLYGSKCIDLSPLENMPLQHLILNSTPVKDLRPLRNLLLKELDLANTAVTDLTPVKNMPLTTLRLDNHKVALLSQIKEIHTLTTLLGIDTSILMSRCSKAIKEKDFTRAKTEARKVLAEYEGIPALTNTCAFAKWTMEFMIPLLERGGEIPPGAISAEGHHYCTVPAAMKWEDAKVFAESLGGHLLTITNDKEWEWFMETFPEHDGFLLGGYKDRNSDQWKWITGEKWKFAPWATGQPDNRGSNEDFINIYMNGFNDCDRNTQGRFIVEWDR